MKKSILILISIFLLAIIGNTIAQQAANSIARPYTELNSKLNIQPLPVYSPIESVESVGDPINILDALIAGADYLKQAQADVTEDNAGNGNPDVPDDPDDGGWDWTQTLPDINHSTSASPTNIYGATAQGLYYAYLETGDASYFTALEDAANIMEGNANIRSAADLIFLMKFQDLPGATADIYKDAAKAKFDARISTYLTATAFAEYIRDVRAGQGYENGIIPWDIGAWAVAAQMLEDRYPSDPYDYAQAADDMAEVLYQDSYNTNPGFFDLTSNKNNGWDPTYETLDYYWYTLGITGLIDAFYAADVHTSEISGLITILLNCQYDDGAFSYCYGANTDDEDWQSTAYAVLSLARVDQPTYQTNINHAAYWTGATQDASGAWAYSSGSHYPEIGGENTAALYFGENASTVWVDDDFTSTSSGGHVWGYDAFATIQNGIDAVADGGTVNVAAGNYTEPLNIENRIGLTINGEDKTLVIIQPTSVLDFNVGGYGSSRTAAFRVVNSTNVTIQNVTLDMDVVKANFVHAILYWDSEGIVNNNIFENLALPDASDGYYEIGSDYRAPGYTDAVRAQISITNNTFIEMGRLCVVTHDYVHATIAGNTFYKLTDDFGYAVEIGGPSSASISNNTMYGFDTPALSDGSESAGIYIENAFTSSITSPVLKNVTVENNEIYDSQYGMWIGNGYDGFAGDVDINVTLNNNNIHDNTDGGAWIQDEDKENGSSVTVNGSSNTLLNNGSYGYFIYTEGDGDILVDLGGEEISGNDYGIYLSDNSSGASNSSYDVTITNSILTPSTSYGIFNDYSGTIIDAENNWWGDNTGPYHATLNPGGLGDAVSDYVDFDPWTEQLSITQTGIDYTFHSNTVTLNFSTLPSGGGDVNVQKILEVPDPAPDLGTPIALYLNITSTMANYTFNVTITLDVSSIAGFGPDSKVAYYNSATGTWVVISGTYDAGPPATFTFTTNHFTPFSFFNTPETAYNIYLSSGTGASSAEIYPNISWSLPDPLPTGYPDDPPVNDWSFSGDEGITVYIVPEVGTVFGACDMVIQWDSDMFDFEDVDKTGGIFDGASTQFIFLYDQLSNPGLVTINAARLDNTNFTIQANDYIAQLKLRLKKPGYGPIDFIAMDYRTFDGVGGQEGVYVTANGGGVKAYLGDVTATGDPTTGDGEVDFDDLSLWSLSYWSGVPGYTGGMTNYKVKYDIGPTNDGTVYSLPDIDEKIQFEDLMIFAISYGLSGDDIYPMNNRPLNGPSTQENPVIVSTELPQGSLPMGSEVSIPVSAQFVENLRGFDFRFTYDDNLFEFIGIEKGQLLTKDSKLVTFLDGIAFGNSILVNGAIVGAKESGLHEDGVLFNLKMRVLKSSSASLAISNVELRNNENQTLKSTIAVNHNNGLLPDNFAISQNYPNPFNPTTTIHFQLPEDREVQLVVYNALGQVVRTLVNGKVEAGYHQVEWDGLNDSNNGVTSGIYFYRIQAGEFSQTHKMIFMK